MRIFAPLAVCVAALTVGCASMMNRPDPEAVQFEQRWMGRPETEIIATLGPPTHEASDAKGGHILVWEFKRESLPFCLGGCPRGTPNRVWTVERHAYIGPDALVYKTYWSGS